MDFFPSSVLEETRGLPDSLAAELLLSQLNWDYPDIDNFREIAYRCPQSVFSVLEKARTLERLKHQLEQWERVPCEGEQFQKLCVASEAERDAAAVLISLLPQNSEEKTRQSILLVLAELRHRPEHAATLACNLWTGSEARYWLKELIYSLWFTAPEKIASCLEALWAIWKPYGCHYYRSETHDIILARIQAAVDNQEVERYIQTILFLTTKRGSCHNDRETVEYLLTNLHRFPKKHQKAIADTAISYAADGSIQTLLIRQLARFSEQQQKAILRNIRTSVVQAIQSGYTISLPRISGLSRLQNALPESSAVLFQEVRQICFFARVYFLIWDYGDLDLNKYRRYARLLQHAWPAPLEKPRRRLLKRLLALLAEPA